MELNPRVLYAVAKPINPHLKVHSDVLFTFHVMQGFLPLHIFRSAMCITCVCRHCYVLLTSTDWQWKPVMLYFGLTKLCFHFEEKEDLR